MSLEEVKAGYAGQEVVVRGWMHACRRLAQVTFVLLRRGADVVQVTFTPEEAEAQLPRSLGHESVLEVRGVVAARAEAPGGAEVIRPVVRVLSAVSEAPPVVLHKREAQGSLGTQLDHAAVALRHPRRRAVFRLSAAAMQGFRETLGARGFVEIQTPKLVGGATESGANVFELGYFGQKAWLAQSPQLYKQMMVGVFERVFEVGPVFRAEPHATTRHLSEYVSMDVELGFIEDHRTVMATLREVMAGIMARLEASCGPELALLGVTLPQVPAVIPSITFEEAQAWIEAQHGVSVRGEPDLAPQHERWLGAWAQEAHGSDLLFVTGYPMAKRPFYTHPQPGHPTASNSFDLLFRGVELVTGGQRLHRYEAYEAALLRAGIDPAPLAGYLEAFRYGMPPHGGFAIGLERLVMQLCGLENLRWATLFPRDTHRLSP